MTRVVYVAIASLLLILTLIFFPPVLTEGDLGLCLNSPNQWHIPRFLGWLINSILVFFCASLMDSANKKLNFIPDPYPIMAVALLVLLSCNCLTTSTLTTSTLMLTVNVVCLYIIINCYESPNASREFFIIGTLPAIGAMFQYAFLWMIPAYIGGGIMMKSFRLREFIAFIFGLLAPYWIAFGLGIVSPEEFRMPGELTFINGDVVKDDLTITLIATAIMAVFAFFFSLYNGVKLFSRNSRLRCMNLTFNMMGLMCLLAVIFDFNNFTAYFGSIALWFAIETAALLHLYRLRYSESVLIIILLVFLPLYFIGL